MSAERPGRGRPRKTQPAEAKDSKSSVLSLAKGFRILEAFSGDVEEMTQSEIADLAGLDAGTTFRMLNTLVELGYVARVGVLEAQAVEQSRDG